MKKEKEKIKISVIKGDKLFNKNTPFVINIFSPESKEMIKNSYADLICVIDISGSISDKNKFSETIIKYISGFNG